MNKNRWLGIALVSLAVTLISNPPTWYLVGVGAVLFGCGCNFIIKP